VGGRGREVRRDEQQVRSKHEESRAPSRSQENLEEETIDLCSSWVSLDDRKFEEA